MKTENIRRFGAGTGGFAAVRCFLGLAALALVPASLLAQSSIKVDWVAGGATNAAGVYNHVYNGSASGNFVLQTQFDGPGGMAFDPVGRLFVADVTNRAVRRLDFTTNKSSVFYQFTNPVAPVDVAVDASTNVFVLTSGDNLIRKLNKSGGLISNVTAAGVLTNVVAMSMFKDDSRTNLYVVELGGAVKKVTLPGGVVTTVTTIAGMTTPGGIVALDDGNRLVVSDAGNHIVRVVDANTGVNGIYAGQLGVSGTNDGLGTAAQFNSPRQITKAGDNILIIADYGNNQVRKIDAAGNVSLLYGSLPWFTLAGSGYRDEDYGVYPGFRDGAGGSESVAESRQPYGVVVDGDGNVYVSERYYHVIRKVSGTGLSGPTGSSSGGGTVLPPVKAPTIGIAVRNDVTGKYNFIPITNSSSLSPVTFYTNALVVILPSETGVSTIYTVGGSTNSASGATAPTPSDTVGLPIPDYQVDQFSEPLPAVSGQINPFVIVRAVSLQTGRVSSPVVQAVFNFKTPPPVIVTSNNNAASFTLTDSAASAAIFYSTDGSDPTNGGPFIFNSTSPTLSYNLEVTNLLFKARAFVPNYEGSAVVSNLFTTNSFVANKISFGFENGEASSDFVAAPGSTFLAPVTLSLIPGQKIYGLQFTMQATNVTGPIIPLGAGNIGFQSMLKRTTNTSGLLQPILPQQFLYFATRIQVVAGVTNTVVEGVYTNTALLETSQGFNILGVGWWESPAISLSSPGSDDNRLYNPNSQTLVTYSLAHDNLFPNPQNPGGVIIGGFQVKIPSSAVNGQTYSIQIGRPSASPDGINQSVFIQAPTNNALPNTGSLKAQRIITVGSKPYTVGDVTPFRWFNAGDFGDSPTNKIDVADVIQAFQSVIYGVNSPPPGSDFYNAFDSADAGLSGLLTASVGKAAIDAMKHGDGNLDINDIFVTYQRALFADLKWYQRYWTNIGGVSTQVVVTVPNIGTGSGNRPAAKLAATAASITNGEAPFVRFTAEDIQANPGQTIQVPIRARVKGGLPIKVLMQNMTVEALDGAPPITQQVSLWPVSGLGAPFGGAQSKHVANVSGVFLDNTLAGVSGTNLIGTLQVTLPTNIPPGAAYAVRFDRISGSPNGLGIFPQAVDHGLITFGSRRTNSFWNDGIPDSWRLRHFGTVSNYLSAADGDADGDGIANWAEYRAGTSPVDSTSNLRLLSAQALTSGATPPSGATLTVPTVDGKNYLLEYCSSLFGTNWSTVTNFTGTGVNVQLQDSSNSTGEPRFYRIRLQE